MAVEMMHFSAMDKQFIDDNMLTDEDFKFAEKEFDVPVDSDLIANFAKDIELPDDIEMNNEKYILSYINSHMSETSDIPADLTDLFKQISYNIDCKMEPLSPNSSESSEVYCSDNDVSVITIPEVANTIEVPAVLTDTPPHTPCGLMDSSPASPASASVEPIIVSVSSLSGISCTIPQNTQAVINPVKYTLNIKPKVESTTKGAKKATIQTIIPKTGHKTILTPEQMEKLAKGTLQIRAPPNVASPYSKVVQSNKAALESLVAKIPVKNGLGKKNSLHNNLEAAAIKRQERIIKNRESAYLSRKRKKEYVQKLEAELNQITAENSSLREENCRLKLKISDLEKEISKLRTAFSPKNMKKTVCLMVVLFMLTFNLAPYSSIFEKASSSPLKSDFSSHRIGRTLLWDASNNSTEEKNESKSLFRKLRRVPDTSDNTYIVDLEKSYNASSCQHFINKTESLRLESDLLGWVERVEKKRVQTKLKKQKFHIENTFPHIASWSRRRAEFNKDIWARRKNRNEILIYETPRTICEDFFDAIHRRDDTFYFVSFSGDHLLLPAITHNKTLRPRMSFVMPAMTLNESVGDSDDHISMMQIDCEVMDTKLVHIKESVIPEHLRQKQNNTSKAHSRNTSEYSNYRQARRLQADSRLPQKSRTRS